MHEPRPDARHAHGRRTRRVNGRVARRSRCARRITNRTPSYVWIETINIARAASHSPESTQDIRGSWGGGPRASPCASIPRAVAFLSLGLWQTALSSILPGRADPRSPAAHPSTGKSQMPVAGSASPCLHLYWISAPAKLSRRERAARDGCDIPELSCYIWRRPWRGSSASRGGSASLMIHLFDIDGEHVTRRVGGIDARVYADSTLMLIRMTSRR